MLVKPVSRESWKDLDVGPTTALTRGVLNYTAAKIIQALKQSSKDRSQISLETNIESSAIKFHLIDLERLGLVKGDLNITVPPQDGKKGQASKHYVLTDFYCNEVRPAILDRYFS